MELTKTNFIQFLNCPKSLWLLKHEPEIDQHGNFSAFRQKLTKDGYEVERIVMDYFRKLGTDNINFQVAFRVDNVLFVKVDALEKKENGEVFLYEVKSSTKVKNDLTQNHLKDACFQKICAEAAGQKIDRAFIVHLNQDYVRRGEIDPIKLLEFADVTTRLEDIVDETKAEIYSAIDLLKQAKIDRDGCSCLYKSRANHCYTFPVFNPNIKKPSIYELPMLSSERRRKLVNKGIFSLLDLPENFDLSKNQKIVLRAAKSRVPQINYETIKSFLLSLRFPLYFFDYETFGSAVPIIDHIGPHEQFPVQYSLHILSKDGNLSHKEYLEREARLPDRLILQMMSDIGDQGNIVSWHASFEKTINQKMAVAFPDNATFLNDMNDRMVDLEKVFKTDYVDVRFDGSTSIKKVLPVICPKHDYKDLNIQDGSSAMGAWQRMINDNPNESERIARSLLSYCKRDTLAMVKIYLFLTRLYSSRALREEVNHTPHYQPLN